MRMHELDLLHSLRFLQVTAAFIETDETVNSKIRLYEN